MTVNKIRSEAFDRTEYVKFPAKTKVCEVKYISVLDIDQLGEWLAVMDAWNYYLDTCTKYKAFYISEHDDNDICCIFLPYKSNNSMIRWHRELCRDMPDINNLELIRKITC